MKQHGCVMPRAVGRAKGPSGRTLARDGACPGRRRGEPRVVHASFDRSSTRRSRPAAASANVDARASRAGGLVSATPASGWSKDAKQQRNRGIRTETSRLSTVQVDYK